MSFLFRAIGSFFLDIIETVVIALSVFLIVYLFFMQPHQVNGQSMVPTFHHKDYLLTDKISYKLRSPERGEMVVFHAPDNAGCPPGGSCDFIKRIIGVPGDTIEVRGGEVYVNGSIIDEYYLPNETTTHAGAYTRDKVVHLGQDQYFVMGDNRDHSSDSRAWGPVTIDALVGKVFFRYWPVTKAGVLKADPLDVTPSAIGG